MYFNNLLFFNHVDETKICFEAFLVQGTLSGRVLYLRPRGFWVTGGASKTHKSLLSTGSTQEDLS